MVFFVFHERGTIYVFLFCDNLRLFCVDPPDDEYNRIRKSKSEYTLFFIMTTQSKQIVINTDGGARGNPGPAGVGVVIADGKGAVLKEFSKYVGEQTNNWAEYEAVSLALGELKKIVPKPQRTNTHIEIRMDSELAVKQFNEEYQVKDEALQLQFMKVHNLRVSEFPQLTFVHVPREKNKEADRLANEAMDSSQRALL